MTRSLLFHTFDSSNVVDQFYDIDLSLYCELIFELSKIINPSQYILTFDDGYQSIKPAIIEAHELNFKTIIYI